MEHDFKERKCRRSRAGGTAEEDTAGEHDRRGQPDHEDDERGIPAVLPARGGREAQIVVLAEVVNNASDHGVLPTVLELHAAVLVRPAGIVPEGRMP